MQVVIETHEQRAREDGNEVSSRQTSGQIGTEIDRQQDRQAREDSFHSSFGAFMDFDRGWEEERAGGRERRARWKGRARGEEPQQKLVREGVTGR